MVRGLPSNMLGTFEKVRGLPPNMPGTVEKVRGLPSNMLGVFDDSFLQRSDGCQVVRLLLVLALQRAV